MKLLLHACCGPCSLEPVRLLQEAGHDIGLAFINPNIHPQEEYAQRLLSLKTWTDSSNIPLFEGEYNPQEWEQAVAGAVSEHGDTPLHGEDRADRCRACYRLRLQKTAAYARKSGFEGIATTLSVSPYQFLDIIQEELDDAAQTYGLHSVFEDFRPYYRQASQRSRDLGMYRQNYCGCHFSNIEAAEERAERKRLRKAEKEARRIAKAKEAAALDESASSK